MQQWSAPIRRSARSAAAVALISAALLATASIVGAAEPAPAMPGQQALAAYLAKHTTRVAFHAVRLADGAVVATRDGQTPMLPASVQKLATSAVALSVLGESFRYNTTAALCNNSLLVVGDGDPTFGDPFIAAARNESIHKTHDAWAAALRRRGVTHIAGDIVLDDGIFRAGRHPDWPAGQRQRWYCAPVGGLNFNDNCLDVLIRLRNGVPTISLTPASRFLTLDNRLRVANKHLWGVRLGTDDAVATFTGTVSQTMTDPLNVAINDPAMLFGRTLAERLARAGITLGGVIRRQPTPGPNRLPPGAKLIGTHVTPLALAMARANKRSLNMTAECLLLRAAAKTDGQATFPGAAKLAAKTLVEQYGLAPEQFTVADGSGMSRRNRLSPAATVHLLRRLAAAKHAKTFLSSLSVATVDGTLRKRMLACQGKVIGKTGSLAGVATIAGYVLDDTGTPAIAFAIFCNRVAGGNWQAKQMQDALIADWTAQAARP